MTQQFTLLKIFKAPHPRGNGTFHKQVQTDQASSPPCVRSESRGAGDLQSRFSSNIVMMSRCIVMSIPVI